MIFKWKKTSLILSVGGKKIDIDVNTEICMPSARLAFNQLISTYSEEYKNNIHYWMLKISERNTLCSSLFLDVCYIFIIEKYLNKYGKKLIIETNNIGLYQHFKTYLGCRIPFYSRVRFKFILLKTLCLPYLKAFRFLLIFSIRHFSALFTRCFVPSIKGINESYILQTWTGINNWQHKQYKESYFGHLEKFLITKGNKVVIWPILYNNQGFFNALYVMRKNSQRFLVTEDFLKYNDYWMTAFFSLTKISQFDFSKATIKLDEHSPLINLHALFNYHLHLEGPEIGLLLYYFCQRLHQKKVNDLKIIYLFENMIAEKGFLLGARKWIKKTRLIGYFHSSKPKNILCLEYASEKESHIAPKPDCIIFNSPSYKTYYQQRFPHLYLKNGYTFKLNYLSNIPCSHFTKTQSLLVIFSGNEADINLLLFFMAKNIDLFNEYHIVIKSHPLRPVKLNEVPPLKKVSMSDKPLDVLFPQASKVLATYSLAVIEACFYQKPVGLLYEKTSLILNPLDDTGLNAACLIKDRHSLVHFLFNYVEIAPISTLSNLFNFELHHQSVFLNELT